MILVDSTVLIDFLRGEKTAIHAIKEESVILYTTEINVFELVTGTYAGKKNQKEHLERIFAMLSRMIILPLNRKATMKAGEIAGTLLKEGKRIEETDSLIAGIALSNGINTILTQNKSHYERISELDVISY
ncbi:PIN domain nuclease [Candidatus Woesearchaeota archaeon CG10_big_fil_rev_8_21_14_0_10_34_8]|nr:MAG: PIN domain nuclease [Candidatus Woesearchaeota archaeon CG10_big_fil_rev_8_21_14_0_10_34_8]